MSRIHGLPCRHNEGSGATRYAALICSALLAASTACVSAPPPQEPVRTSIYDQGEFRTSPDCAYRDKAEGDWRGFVCGSLLIGLTAETSEQDRRALLRTIDGRIAQVHGDSLRPWVAVTVKPGTEALALRRLANHRHVRFAEPNWNGRVNGLADRP